MASIYSDVLRLTPDLMLFGVVIYGVIMERGYKYPVPYTDRAMAVFCVHRAIAPLCVHLVCRWWTV